MGRRGPKALPLEILNNRGSSAVRKQRHKRARPEPKSGIPSTPVWLDAEGKREWARKTKVLSELGMLKPSDRGAIAGMCQSWSLFVRTATQINKTTNWADMGARRVTAMCSQAYNDYLKTCREFGLTPSSRADGYKDLEVKQAKSELEEWLDRDTG